MKSVNETGAFLDAVGFAILILGGIGSVYLATINGGFDFVIFIGCGLSVCVTGGLVKGIAEIIKQLQQIQINTTKQEIGATTVTNQKRTSIKYVNVEDKCPACGGKLDQEANKCPGCGLNFN